MAIKHDIPAYSSTAFWLRSFETFLFLGVGAGLVGVEGRLAVLVVVSFILFICLGVWILFYFVFPSSFLLFW